MSKLSIIVPVYFNADTLEMLYRDMKDKILAEIGEYEIVFVDDGSGDESWQIMNKLKDEDANIKCVKLSRNFGEHAALLAGLSVCSGDCAVTKQADLQEDSSIILEMYEKWKQGSKVVLAVRASRDENAVKKFFANLYYFIIRKMVTSRMPDGGCDCYLVDRKVIQVLELMDEKNSSLTLQVLWAGFKTDYVYFHRKDREVGKSRWTLAKKIKLVADSVLSFSYAPMKFAISLGLLFCVFAVIVGIDVIVEKATVGTPIMGWASLMCVLLVAAGLNFVILGILGEYIWRTLDASRARPPFIIDEINSSEKTKGE